MKKYNQAQIDAAIGAADEPYASIIKYLDAKLYEAEALVLNIKTEDEHIRQTCITHDTYKALEENLGREKDEAELIAFAVVRNSVVAPVGHAKGKTEKEISLMTVETLAEIRKMLDFDAMRAFRSLAKENK